MFRQTGLRASGVGLLAMSDMQYLLVFYPQALDKSIVFLFIAG